jgi:golgi-specific brefeldin A-resistance guanine nucleotide exchange factor 1
MGLLNVNSSSGHGQIDRDSVSSSLIAGSGGGISASGGLSDPVSEQMNEQISINFGTNNKAQLACKTVFQLIHSHGDILRDGWKNILDCILQLYKCKLLPKVLVECEDYMDRTGRILLIKDKSDTIDSTSIDASVNSSQSSGGGGLFSFFPFMSSSSDANIQKGPSPEDLEAIKNAKTCIDECHIEQLIHDTKFLRVDSLLEFIKALIFNQTGSLINGPSEFLPENEERFPSLATSTPFRLIDNDCSVFSLETLIKVVLQNRDRITCIWPIIRNHFYNIIMSTNFVLQQKMSCSLSQATTKPSNQQKSSKNNSRHPVKSTTKPIFPFDSASLFFIERTIVGLLRITARLLRRDELANEVLTCLRMLLLFRRKTLVRKLARQVTYGVHDLLRTNAANIHTSQDWSNIFAILKVYGAGANPPTFSTNNSSSHLSTKNKLHQTNKNE